MGILKKAVKEQAYLKAGVFGFAGSGKTYTSAMLAMGISKRLGDGKPVAFFDTETGSDFLVDVFEREKVELLQVKSRAFTHLTEAMREAEQTCSVFIVDSVSHIWRELQESYKKRFNKKKIEFQGWGEIKGQWQTWTDWFINSKIHVIVCGRAGNEYEYQEDDDTGKKELIKGDTKMKTEGEFGYEPSLLIEMVRGAREGENKKQRLGWKHVATVLKDRTDTVNGQQFTFSKPRAVYQPGDWENTFKPFKPIFDSLNIGGTHRGLDTESSSEVLFQGTDSGAQRKRRVEIALEEITGSIVALWPGQDAKGKQCKGEIVYRVFGTRSWEDVKGRSMEELERGVEIFRVLEETAKDCEVEGIERLVEQAKEQVASKSESNE